MVFELAGTHAADRENVYSSAGAGNLSSVSKFGGMPRSMRMRAKSGVLRLFRLQSRRTDLI
jgi:hypothetical protein